MTDRLTEQEGYRVTDETYVRLIEIDLRGAVTEIQRADDQWLSNYGGRYDLALDAVKGAQAQLKEAERNLKSLHYRKYGKHYRAPR